MNQLLKEIRSKRIFLDGGTGSVLQSEGLKPGELPETWNLDHPENVIKLHYDYFLAGSNIVNTNTFGANRLKFDSETLDRVVVAAINHAKEARRRIEEEPLPEKGFRPKNVDAKKESHYIALDIGPTGKLLKPLGDLDFEEAVSIFAEVVKIGEREGCDLILIETMNDSYEVKAAVLAAKENSSLPVFVSTVYDEGAKLLTGANPAAMVSMLEGLHVDAIGMNCSLGPAQMKSIVPMIKDITSLPVLVKPNAGLPHAQGTKTVYDVDQNEFASIMQEIVRSGASIIGGCCGTTPEYICRLVEACDKIPFEPIKEKNFSMVSSHTHAVFLGGKPVLVGERINPTGKSKLKQALRDHNLDYLVQEAITQEEKGADVLDVNVGLPEIDEPAMMVDVITELQSVTDLPLQVDTSDPVAMEKALRVYNGKALVNSVNGKQEVMKQIFPIVQKYGGVVVALTLDEGGIPETAEGRIAIAEKIYATAAQYGIQKKDIIIDPLAMAVSSSDTAAIATLQTLKQIHDEFGGNTILGVSNISFGLPQRELITSTFFTMAMQNGLSAAIMNPNSVEMMKVYHGFLTLTGQDPQCMGYIQFAEGYDKQMHCKYGDVTNGSGNGVASNGVASNEIAADASAKEAVGQGWQEKSLEYAIVHGLKTPAFEATLELLKTMKPLDIINDKLIPALDYVGKGFEKKTVYLPQLLMSAEAAKSSFSAIKDHLTQSGMEQEKKGVIILATVKGDIHDIGKNIVKVILENYGYDVIDLGKDVEPQLIVDECVKHHALLVGLSALMTTTVPSMQATIELLKEHAPWAKTVVGGAVLNKEYAQMIHADYYAKDAMETVAVAKLIYQN